MRLRKHSLQSKSVWAHADLRLNPAILSLPEQRLHAPVLTRVRNRCSTTGRPRGYYRKFGLNRIELRDLGNKGLIPGLTKSSW